MRKYICRVKTIWSWRRTVRGKGKSSPEGQCGREMKFLNVIYLRQNESSKNLRIKITRQTRCANKL